MSNSRGETPRTHRKYKMTKVDQIRKLAFDKLGFDTNNVKIGPHDSFDDLKIKVLGVYDKDLTHQYKMTYAQLLEEFVDGFDEDEVE